MPTLIIDFPTWIKPELIPGLPIRWYAIMYLVAFFITYKLFMRLNKKGEMGFEISEDDSYTLFMYEQGSYLPSFTALSSAIFPSLGSSSGLSTKGALWASRV